MALIDEVREEIESLHRFFTGWFRGELPVEGLSELDARLAPGFINIQPAGRVLTLEELRLSIAGGHGANPAFEIEIHDVHVRWSCDDESSILATYVELQHGARNSQPPTNRRISTVLFQRSESRLQWQHVHETKLP